MYCARTRTLSNTRAHCDTHTLSHTPSISRSSVDHRSAVLFARGWSRRSLRRCCDGSTCHGSVRRGALGVVAIRCTNTICRFADGGTFDLLLDGTVANPAYRLLPDIALGHHYVVVTRDAGEVIPSRSVCRRDAIPLEPSCYFRDLRAHEVGDIDSHEVEVPIELCAILVCLGWVFHANACLRRLPIQQESPVVVAARASTLYRPRAPRFAELPIAAAWGVSSVTVIWVLQFPLTAPSSTGEAVP